MLLLLSALHSGSPITAPLKCSQSSEFQHPVSDEVPVASQSSVLQKLSTLNTTKVQGPDGIPGWLLKDNADLLMEPITEILNISYFENCLPSSWKEAYMYVVPVPKQTPIKDVNKHLRPISLTPILFKIAEDYVVDEYVKPAGLLCQDYPQFVHHSCIN